MIINEKFNEKLNENIWMFLNTAFNHNKLGCNKTTTLHKEAETE